jgi:site-specific DNA recombinase
MGSLSSGSAVNRGGIVEVNKTAAIKTVRCAIYTRKSTEEGLGQSFNSLDAQREAAESYIRSQKHEGWVLLPTDYSDGGYTGANIERPGVRQLLAAIDAGEVDCVVVYKVDRLSRSLIDFAKMMELFEKRGVCFVSVTQQFNTNMSLGRLTLNILLSFAQFEREIISERTRDKHIAARKKGKWTGGHLILGYDLDSSAGRLTVNASEARIVRSIFEWYLCGESVIAIVAKARQLGWKNKQWTTRNGKLYGGQPLRRTHLYNLLANTLYSGRVQAGEELFNGEHEAIIDVATFELVQSRLKQNSTVGGSPHRTKMESLLRGLIYCSSCGSAMYQTYSSNKERRYRYYVCPNAQQRADDHCATRSISAPAVENAVVQSIQRVGVHPQILRETEQILRNELTKEQSRLREALSAIQVRVKNYKSQIARMGAPNAVRLDDLQNQISNAQQQANALKLEIQSREQALPATAELLKEMTAFDGLWKSMTTAQRSQFLRLLVEKVGYNGRTEKITVSFKSTGTKALCKQ